MTDVTVAAEGEIAVGDRAIVEADGVEIGVFNLGGEYRAYENWCPHQGADVCTGRVTGTIESTFDRESLREDRRWTGEGRILVCPRHAWEFDIEDGRSRARRGVGLVSYPVRVEDDEIVVSVE